MLFENNMELLRTSFPGVWKKIQGLKGGLDDELVRVVSNKGKASNLKAGAHYIHDQNDPGLEAAGFIQKFDIEGHTDILFYGVGMGYQVNAYLEQYTDVPFSIYEPVPEIFYAFLHCVDLAKLPLRLIEGIYIESSPHDMKMACSHITRKVRRSMLVISLPSYQQIFPQRYKAFFDQFEKELQERRTSVATTLAFEKRWTINSMKNLIHILKSPNILLEDNGAYRDKPAVLVAAGPSLEDDIDNLRMIGNNQLAYIFSVGTAINTLIRNGIHPYAACTYDPTEENRVVYQGIRNRGVKTIPLLFGSTVGYETLEEYPSPHIHALIRQDRLSAYYLKPRDGEHLETVNDAATIAVIGLQLMFKLGFNPIILVGQNLAYRNGKRYAEGSTYHTTEVGLQELAEAVMVPDVYGNEVPSSLTFIRMKKQLEHYIREHKDFTVINTSRGGAHIEGTIFRPLDEIISDQLKAPAVDVDLDFASPCSYNMEYLREQHFMMQGAYKQVRQLLKKCRADLDYIIQVKGSNDAIAINSSYEQFNQSMKLLRRNRFITTFIEPMNRMELEFLMLATPRISALRNPISKARAMETEFRPYLSGCEQDLNTLEPIYKAMNSAIEELSRLDRIRTKGLQTKLLLIDYEGVLTDGKIYYSASGKQVKAFSQRDFLAIRILREKDIGTILLCMEEDPIMQRVIDESGILAVYQGNKNESIAAIADDYKCNYMEMAGIFSDPSETAMLKNMGLSFTVSNHVHPPGGEVDYVLKAGGGEGALMEAVGLMLGINVR